MSTHSHHNPYVNQHGPALINGKYGDRVADKATLGLEGNGRDTETDEENAIVGPWDRAAQGASQTLPPLARAFLNRLLRLQLLNVAGATEFLNRNKPNLPGYAGVKELGSALVAEGLLTQYQLDRISAGKFHGLVLGNHRVLDRLGAGGMGVVFRAEHVFMKRQVAIKVFPVEDDCPPTLLGRFYSEMQVLAQLHHPHIVTAYDSGHVRSPGCGEPSLLYLAMELVEGGDLESYVYKHGTPKIGTACQWIAQAASGLQEAHNHHLVHRDIKPSNLLLSRQEQIKVVDFGLVQQMNIRNTTRGAILGTIDFMPPEQSLDASSVGVAADIYGLGATLFWLLTKEAPHPRAPTIREAFNQLQGAPARSIRTLRSDVPPELEAFIQLMLERDPAKRPASPSSVCRILGAFCDCRIPPDWNVPN